jgi:hypothetical protein
MIALTPIVRSQTASAVAQTIRPTLPLDRICFAEKSVA